LTADVPHPLDLNFVPLSFRTVLETLFFRRILGSVTVERVIMDMSQVLEYIRDILLVEERSERN
jgi:hypothetical protein